MANRAQELGGTPCLDETEQHASESWIQARIQRAPTTSLVFIQDIRHSCSKLNLIIVLALMCLSEFVEHDA